MIDWVNALLPCRHKPIFAGGVISYDKDKQIEWHSEKHFPVEGSFSSKVMLRSYSAYENGDAIYLAFRGNPSKFLQGHNVFGSDDLLSLMEATYLKILEILNINPVLSDFHKIKSGQYPISRLDINYMYELPTHQDVLAWIRSASYSSKTRHGKAIMKGDTLYWGKNSKRWLIKAYSKADELKVKGRGLDDKLKQFPIEKWSENKLRLELVLQQREINTLGIEMASDFTEQIVRDTFNDYITRIEMNNKLMLTNAELDKLPSRLKNTYLLWKEGYPLLSTMNERTYRRHRADLKKHGINIDLEPKSQKDIHSNVVPLIRILEAKPAQIPQWAYDNNLIFTPLKKAI